MRPWLVAAFALACAAPEPECLSTVDCGGGLQACLGGACVEVECLSGGDCPIEQYCQPEDYTCEPGCSASDDCLIGDRCDVTTNTCVPRECTETQADCALGERCDPTTGACAPDPAPYCKPCRGDEQCGPTGMCARLTERSGAYCLLECSPEAFDPCPAGLQCSATTGEDGSTDFRCVGLCGEL